MSDDKHTEEERSLIPIGARVFGSGDARSAVIKALIAGGDPEVAHSNAGAVGEEDTQFEEAGAIQPPVNPSKLLALFEFSNALRQNIDSYATNIDGFGHHFEPIIHPDDEDFRIEIEDYLRDQQEVDDEPLFVDGESVEPKQVEAEIARIRREMRREYRRLVTAFEMIAGFVSFIMLRRKTRQDLESIGSGYWEVLRDNEGKPAQFVHLASQTMRLRPLNPEPVEVSLTTITSPLEPVTRTVSHKFRTFVQIIGGQTIYFKEFGDSRLVSAKTGDFWDDLDKMQAKEGKDATPATEVHQFSIHSSRSPYGIVRWAGVILAALGSHEAENVNLLYFENKSVPPLALLVSGGRVSEETVDRIKDFIENEIKGSENYHKILVLEAEAAPSGSGVGPGVDHTGRMRIQLVPLTSAIHSDALFQKYDERNMLKIGQAFRLPALLRGDSRDFNRATAMAVLKFAESQVFAPERNLFDDFINRRIMPELGVRYWKFVSNSPRTTDPLDQAKVLESLTKVGGLLPEDARVVAEDILNAELTRSDQPWMRIPFALAVAGRVDERALFDRPIRETPGSPEQPLSDQPDTVDPGEGDLPFDLPMETDGTPEEDVFDGSKRDDKQVVVVPRHIWDLWQKGFTPHDGGEEESQ